MKKMLSLYTLALLFIFGGCDKDDDPVLTQRDWDTTTYFSSTEEPQSTTYYKPYVGYVGDPMPFYDPVNRDFKILYLQDYTSNATGTYHPAWGLRTTDAASYESLGELVPCGGISEQDAALGTGSVFYNSDSGRYYFFYTGNKYNPSSSENGQVVMMATSEDFETWTKNKTFYLKGDDYGYAKHDFRDPFIFEGDDGLYHMLVSTTYSSKGVLAEFTSNDLESWEHQGIFMYMMWDRFYECPDLFKMGDWWYLVYSEKHAAIRKVQYFKGSTLEELKACTADDAGIWPDSKEGFLDSRAYYAGKTASDGTNRYIWGWCPRRSSENNTDVGAYPDEPEWGGSLVAHKVVQLSDGTLALQEVDAISAKYTDVQSVEAKLQDGSVSVSNGTYSLQENAYVLFNRLGTHNKISFTATTSGATDTFGFSFARGSDSDAYYSIIVNPENDGASRKLNFEEEGQAGIGFVDGIDSFTFDAPQDGVYDVTVYTDNSVVVVYINGVLNYTNRIYALQKNCWSINSYSGSTDFSNIKIYTY